MVEETQKQPSKNIAGLMNRYECYIKIEPLRQLDPTLAGKIDVRDFPWAQQSKRRVSFNPEPEYHEIKKRRRF
ncbi:unnamed protein product [Bursaphelenchus xylophilus]|uniref:(pine wood nematode) hypothetical protein n=1 Tax=Bursaphelenchus xylophilus TaxID=6326 RepID=A0A1I7SEQ7_BURXY|nr:unnamed protein product [Bursaphelenchus xylophilus]CAG9128258.1 unnamed protein product [Bursaphelenchus xylophilus]